jgi:hypothetical protein
MQNVPLTGPNPIQHLCHFVTGEGRFHIRTTFNVVFEVVIPELKSVAQSIPPNQSIEQLSLHAQPGICLEGHTKRWIETSASKHQPQLSIRNRVMKIWLSTGAFGDRVVFFGHEPRQAQMGFN